MGNLLNRPFDKCVKAYDEYTEEKKEKKKLEEKDKTNIRNKGNDKYQYKSFLEDQSFMENQKWINKIQKEKILFHPEKLISAYNDYQFDQVNFVLYFYKSLDF